MKVKDLTETQAIKTLADFKRAAVVGSKWHTLHHGYDGHVTDMGVREICSATASKIKFKLLDGRESTFDFPRASQLKFDRDTVRFYWPDGHLCLTYTLICN